MKRKVCSFAINFMHAKIITENFIRNNFNEVNVIYISEEEVRPNLDKLELKDNENTNNKEENVQIYIIYGGENFIEKTNKFLKMNSFSGYIINVFNIANLQSKSKEIIKKHDFYINTTEVFYMKKEL